MKNRAEYKCIRLYINKGLFLTLGWLYRNPRTILSYDALHMYLIIQVYGLSKLVNFPCFISIFISKAFLKSEVVFKFWILMIDGYLWLITFCLVIISVLQQQ